MISSKQVLDMEVRLKANLSLGFFEHGSHTGMDLVFYEAYSAVQSLRIILDEYEKELREAAEDLRG